MAIEDDSEPDSKSVSACNAFIGGLSEVFQRAADYLKANDTIDVEHVALAQNEDGDYCLHLYGDI